MYLCLHVWIPGLLVATLGLDYKIARRQPSYQANAPHLRCLGLYLSLGAWVPGLLVLALVPLP